MFLHCTGSKIKVFEIIRILNLWSKLFKAVYFWSFQGPIEHQENNLEKTRSFHQYLCNSEIDTTFISLISWPRETSVKKCSAAVLLSLPQLGQVTKIKTNFMCCHVISIAQVLDKNAGGDGLINSLWISHHFDVRWKVPRSAS